MTRWKFSFTLKTLLICAALAAAYCAGVVSERILIKGLNTQIVFLRSEIDRLEKKIERERLLVFQTKVEACNDASKLGERILELELEKLGAKSIKGRQKTAN